MRIAIYGRKFSDDFIPYFQNLIYELDSNKIEYVIYSRFYKFLKKKNIIFPKNVQEYTRKTYPTLPIDFLFTIGGDGTILDTISSIKKGIPIVAVNSGRLGFLSNTAKTEIKEVISQLKSKDISFYAPFDGIIVTAGAPFVPNPLLSQLKIGGKLLIPIGDETQIMTLFIRKSTKEFEKHELGDFAFVPMLEEKN